MRIIFIKQATVTILIILEFFTVIFKLNALATSQEIKIIMLRVFQSILIIFQGEITNDIDLDNV